MGTLVDKLQAALDSKKAIKEKFNLPDNLPFSKYAENIKVEGGGSTVNTIEFYKCASLGSNTGNGGASTIIYQVSNAGTPEANGGYWDSGKAWSDGGDAYPLLTNGTCFMRYSSLSMTWSIYDSYADGTWGTELYCLEGSSSATDSGWFEIFGTTPSPTVTSGGGDTNTSVPEDSEKVWNGHKAVLIEETVTTEGETVIVVSGATSMPDANGTYRPSNSETGQSAIYTSEDGQFRLFMEEVMYGHWCIMKGENNYDGVYYSQRSGTNPWDSNTTDWTYESPDIMNEYPTGKPESLTITQETLAGSAEIKRYYTFDEDTLITGLTYGYGFTPEVGQVYDAEAMIQVTLFENIPLISTPENMTSHENTDWVVSAHSEYGSYYAWKAFDNDLGTKWDHESSAFWIQWQNKKTKVLVKELIVRCGDMYGLYGDKCFLQGSDDGEHWVDIARGDWGAYRQTQDGLQVYTLTFPDNETSYFYHRLGNDAGGMNAKIHEMVAYSKIQ